MKYHSAKWLSIPYKGGVQETETAEKQESPRDFMRKDFLYWETWKEEDKAEEITQIMHQVCCRQSHKWQKRMGPLYRHP